MFTVAKITKSVKMIVWRDSKQDKSIAPVRYLIFLRDGNRVKSYKLLYMI